jgi:hypothetical protein
MWGRIVLIGILLALALAIAIGWSAYEGCQSGSQGALCWLLRLLGWVGGDAQKTA